MFRNKLHVVRHQNVRIPAHLNFGKFILENLRRMSGDAVAIENVDSDEKMTYEEVTQHAVKMAVALHNLGVRPGDVVAVGSEPQIKCLSTMLAVIFCGSTLTPLGVNVGKTYLEHKLNVAKPKYILCTELFWDKYENFLQNYEPGIIAVRLEKDLTLVDEVDIDLFEPSPVQGQTDTAIIAFTSGTTGLPKGIQLTHLNCLVYCSKEGPKDTQFTLSKVFVNGNLEYACNIFSTITMLTVHNTVVFTVNDTYPDKLVIALQNGQVETAVLRTTLINLLIKTEFGKNFTLERLHTVVSFGNILHDRTIKKLKENNLAPVKGVIDNEFLDGRGSGEAMKVQPYKNRFPSIKRVVIIYGMTETSAITAEYNDWEVKTYRVGGGVHLKVKNPVTLELLGPNQQGKIFMKGPGLMKGYIGVDPSTYLDEDGWFDTGDLGYYGEDGSFFITGRNNDVINCNDDIISLHELEYAVMSHPAVFEAGVVGKPDPVYGEVPAAFVVRQPGSAITAKELIDFIAEQFPASFRLNDIRFVPSLPKSGNGKILRRSLVDMLNNATA